MALSAVQIELGQDKRAVSITTREEKYLMNETLLITWQLILLPFKTILLTLLGLFGGNHVQAVGKGNGHLQRSDGTLRCEPHCRACRNYERLKERPWL